MPDQPSFETFFVLKPPQLPLIEKVLKFNIMILSNFFFQNIKMKKIQSSYYWTQEPGGL
jgi:hypothetical protein